MHCVDAKLIHPLNHLCTSALTPITTYAAEFRAKEEAAFTAVTVISTIFVAGGLLVLGFFSVPQPNRPSALPPKLWCCVLFRFSIMRVIVGFVGVFASFAYISSALTLASAAVVLGTMQTLAGATAIVRGTAAAPCSHPLHAANLAIAASVFCFTDLMTFAFLQGELVLNLGIRSISRCILAEAKSLCVSGDCINHCLGLTLSACSSPGWSLLRTLTSVSRSLPWPSS